MTEKKIPTQLPIEEVLRRSFEVASLRKDAMALKTTRYWSDVRKLGQRCNKVRAREERLYTERYDTRVEEARRRLIDEAASRSRDFKPPWAGKDRFSPDAILRQARRQVEIAHERRLMRITEYERRTLEGFKRQAARETSASVSPRETFAQASTRSPAMERRGGWVRRRDS